MRKKRFLLAVTILLVIVATWVGATTASAAPICTPASTITVPFAKDGAGDFCYQTTSLCTYINSWNLTTLEINGTAYTNAYVTSAAIPPLNGAYTIHYVSAVGWGHFEIAGTCSGGGGATPTNGVGASNTPPPGITPTHTRTATTGGPTLTRTRTPTVGGPSATPTRTSTPAVSTPTLTPTSLPGWNLVWSDEFNGPAIDTSNWGYELGYVRNNEQQYYTNRPENSRIENGNLVIEARRESFNGYAYTSASLLTRGKRQFQYGRFELRAIIPTPSGSWPAWWTLGINNPWPKNGEIDIMEFYRGMILANVAYQNAGGSIVWDSFTKNISDYGPGWSSNYHIWVMEWDANTINLYVDGVLLNTFNVNNATVGSYNPFRQPHYMLVNLAIGGNNGGNPASTIFPLKYYVDYVRVYQR